MSSPGQEFVEIFLQEASEHLQFLREYAGVLLDAYPAPDDLERLYVAAHTLKGSSAMYGFPLFSEIAAKLTHIFQYAMNVGISSDASAPLVEFISEAVALLESDLWFISTNSGEAADDIAAFKARYPFAFQAPQLPERHQENTQPAQPAPDHEQPPPPAPAVSPSIAEMRRPKPETKAESQAQQVETPAQQRPSEPDEPAVTEESQKAVAAVAVKTAEITHVAADITTVADVKPVAVDGLQKPEAPRPLEAKQADAAERHVVTEDIRARQGRAAGLPADTKPETASHAGKPQPPGPSKPAPATESDIELPPDGNLPAEILEFFIPEVEEHLQIATECLLSLEVAPNENDIHKLFRAMHTIKGSAAQVGLPRISLVAHRAEDLIGRLRDGVLSPSANIVDLCLESVDTLKKFLYRQWTDEDAARRFTGSLLSRIARLAPEEKEEGEEEEEERDGATAQGGPAAEAPRPLEISDEVVHPVIDVVADEKSAAAPPVADISTPTVRSSGSPPAATGREATKEPGRAADIDPFVLGDLIDLSPAERSEPFADLFEQPRATPPVPAQTTAPDAQKEGEARPAARVSSERAPRSVLAPPAPAKAAAPAGSKVEVTPEPKRTKTEVESASAKVESEIQPLLSLKKEPVAVAQSRSVRIALERLDRMMNVVGELVINRTRMLGRLAELERLADVLNFSKARMSDKITEFQEKYEFSRITARPSAEPAPQSQAWGAPESFPFRGGYSSYSQKFDASLAEFSELEMDRYDEFSILSRSLTEISADITEILTQLDGFVRRVDSDIDEFTKLAHRLQDEITAARMVPIGNLYTRISRTVRDAAKAAGKQVELQLAGAETELDNNIIQQIADPLLHLVRNSVAHGIERADERYEQGKPDNGNVYVRAYHRGNHIYIEVEDDGRGLDYEKIRATALELGMIAADDAGRLTERDLQDLLFHPGFSTAPKKTELAGRGVGLDVVKANIAALNGEVEIESQKGFGTRFTLKVPLTLIISQALFVRCGDNTYAFPLAFVEEIRRIRETDIEEVGGKLLTKVRDAVTEVVRLDMQLGLPPVEPLNGFYRLVIVNVAGRQVGIVVEEVLRKDEIVIKNLGEYLRNVKLFPGATIAPDGSLILLIDVNRLIAGEAIERRPLLTAANAARLFFPGAGALASGEVPEEVLDVVPEEKVVVLADDSISVRKFVGRMLEKAGYRVKLACDGLEALEIVSQTRCDLVVTDLEMPRTNGYELMAHLRSNPETKDIPVMVVTSRAGMKHRDKAMKQGAIEFLVKPVQEEQFVAVVQRLIGPVGAPVPASAGALQLQGRG